MANDHLESPVEHIRRAAASHERKAGRERASGMFLAGEDDAAAIVRITMADRLSDADLVEAYQRTNGVPGNPEAGALLAEIERRGLDV